MAWKRSSPKPSNKVLMMQREATKLLKGAGAESSTSDAHLMRTKAARLIWQARQVDESERPNY